MSAAKYLMIAEQGADFAKRMTRKTNAGDPINLTGYTARMQIRDKITRAVVLELTTENGRITITGNLGRIDLSIQETDLTFAPGMYDYDLILDLAGDTLALLYGGFFLREAVTE